MKIAILTAATVAALLVSGTTFAASKSTTMNFSFVVASTCEIYLDVDNIEVATFDVVGGNNPENLGVTCSEDLPYIVEASTNAAGQVIAKSTTSAREYPVTFVRGNDTYSCPRFGTDANGLAHSGVGSGAHQSIPFAWELSQPNGDGTFKQLAPGTYTASVTFTVTY
ncbi:hypothetical protein [Stenotrophomonas maltophilia group sp. Smal13]|uniref:hypothetical protein n=1 Tax=Stenotrophomonas maltophilia group sp. Smal13 TaxID=3377166 RepID=UPI0025565E30|nr:hypothetical protein [Stenotrophomonas maltophilia]